MDNWKDYLKRFGEDRKDEIIEFLCYVLAENVDECPSGVYEYTCETCPYFNLDNDIFAKCWLDLAESDTSTNKWREHFNI